jgi:uncharacterized membrane protein YdjX (TVP38/TMEM64 family)
MASAGIWAYLAAPLLMAVVAIFPIPAEAPAMLNGMLFGTWAGSLVTWGGAMAGAWISFELARLFGRPLAERWMSPAAVAKVDGVADGAGWWGLLVVRFIPLIAFTALNWGLGLCKVPRWRFLWTTGLGIAPGTIVFTWSGVGLGELWRRSPAMAGAVLTAVLALSVWAWMRRRRPVEG